MNTKIVYAAGIVIIIIGVIFYFSTYVYNSPSNESSGPEPQTMKTATDSPSSSNPLPQNNNNNNNNDASIGQQALSSSSTPQSNNQNLSLSIDSIDILPSDNNNNVSNLQIAMDVYNPNRGAAILETLSYNVFLNNVRLSSGDIGSRPEGFVDSLESVYTIIGNQTITLRDKVPLSDQGRSLLESGLRMAPASGNNLSSSSPSPLASTGTTTTLPSDSETESYLVNGTYFFTLNRGSQSQSSEYPFSLQFPAK
jgi:hypothetical protein